MKKILYFCCLALIGCVCTGCGQKKADVIKKPTELPQKELHYPKSMIQIEHISKQQKTKDMSRMLILGEFAYPQIDNRDELDTIDAINQEIKETACTEFDKYYNQGLTYAELYYDGLAGGEHGTWVLPFVTEQAFHVKYNDNFILSVKGNGYSDFGGAHPDSYQFSYTYDLKTGEKLPVNYFFGEDEKAAKAYVTQLFVDKVSKDPDLYYEDALLILLKGKYSYGYYLTESGITFYINTYEIAPYATGVIETTLEYNSHDERFKNLSVLGIE